MIKTLEPEKKVGRKDVYYERAPEPEITRNENMKYSNVINKICKRLDPILLNKHSLLLLAASI